MMMAGAPIFWGTAVEPQKELLVDLDYDEIVHLTQVGVATTAAARPARSDWRATHCDSNRGQSRLLCLEREGLLALVAGSPVTSQIT